jgi:hypothetical protein
MKTRLQRSAVVSAALLQVVVCLVAFGLTIVDPTVHAPPQSGIVGEESLGAAGSADLCAATVSLLAGGTRDKRE